MSMHVIYLVIVCMHNNGGYLSSDVGISFTVQTRVEYPTVIKAKANV